MTKRWACCIVPGRDVRLMVTDNGAALSMFLGTFKDLEVVNWRDGFLTNSFVIQFLDPTCTQ